MNLFSNLIVLVLTVMVASSTAAMPSFVMPKKIEKSFAIKSDFDLSSLKLDNADISLMAAVESTTPSPSEAPTFSPTFSPTPVPSAAPTYKRSNDLLIINGEQQFFGISIAQYNADVSGNENLFKSAYAGVIDGLEESMFTITNVVEGDVGGRRLLDIISETVRVHLDALTNSIKIFFKIKIPASKRTQFANGQEAYDSIIASLNAVSASNGDLVTLLMELAAENPASPLFNLTIDVLPPTVSSFSITPVEPDNKTLSNGQIAGLVIGIIFGVILLSIIAYVILKNNRSESIEKEQDVNKEVVTIDGHEVAVNDTQV